MGLIGKKKWDYYPSSRNRISVPENDGPTILLGELQGVKAGTEMCKKLRTKNRGRMNSDERYGPGRLSANRSGEKKQSRRLNADVRHKTEKGYGKRVRIDAT